MLGDSLSTGYQPHATGDPLCSHASQDATGRGGWACILLGKLRGRDSSFQIANLAVNGEDTCDYLRGRSCTGRPEGGSAPQGQQAAGFLRSHRGRVGLITLDIGANDAQALIGQVKSGLGERAAGDLSTVLARARHNYTRILGRLRALAPGVPILALGYYVPNMPPEIPAAVRPLVQTFAQSTALQFNTFVSAAARQHGATYVDLYDAFLGKTSQLINPGDIHPTDAGQRRIAQLVWSAYQKTSS